MLKRLKEVFRPTLFKIIREKTYTKELFLSDLISGIIVGIIAIPLAIAFGIASGVTPQQGIITAIVAGFLVSFFGGTKLQIGGPTGAFIVIVYGIVLEFGMSGLILATILAGVLLIIMGLFKLGSIIKFMPYPIIVGFTSGIAVVIFSSQVNDFLGLAIKTPPADFLGKWQVYFQNIDTANLSALIVGIITLLIIIYSPKFIPKKIPGSLVAIIVTTIAVLIAHNYFPELSIDTIGSRFPELASGSLIPKIEYAPINMGMIRTLIQPAFTIAILCAIESLLSAMVVDGMSGTKHDSNTELIAQGIANIVAPILGGIPATGAIARTMANYNNGGKTPIAGIIHAVVLLAIYVILMPLAVHIPLSCLAGVLVMVAYNMSEIKSFKTILRGPKADVAVLLTTFFLTVIVDLTVAIQVGLVIALVMFFKRVTDTSNIEMIKDLGKNEDQDEDDSELLPKDIAKGIDMYKISGPFSFGIANRFDEIASNQKNKPLVRIIRMSKVPFIDSTGLNNLSTLYKKSKQEGIQLILSGVIPGVYKTLFESGFIGIIGNEFVHPNLSDAIKKGEEIIEYRKKKKDNVTLI